MWIYQQSTGKLFDPKGVHIATGYSGSEDDLGKNKQDLEHKRSVGPIQRRAWVMGDAYRSRKVGPIAIPLTPHGHDARGRTYFRIHGDSVSRPGRASMGCMIFNRIMREQMSLSRDRLLTVIE